MFYVGEIDYSYCDHCSHSFVGLGTELYCDIYCPNFFNPDCFVCKDCKYNKQCFHECFSERPDFYKEVYLLEESDYAL